MADEKNTFVGIHEEDTLSDEAVKDLREYFSGHLNCAPFSKVKKYLSPDGHDNVKLSPPKDDENPWGDFLNVRIKAITHFHNLGYTNQQVADVLSMEAGQVGSILVNIASGHIKTMSKEKKDEEPKDDQNYLVFWKEDDGKWSLAHRAYYLWGKFFSLESFNDHPLHVDKFIKMPSMNEEE